MWLWANDISSIQEGVPNGTLSMVFTCCPTLMFIASLWLEIYRFSNWLFKVDVYFAIFGKIKINPVCSLLLTLDRSQLFCSVWVIHAMKNNPNPLCLIKIQEPCIGSVTSYFQWFSQWKSRTGFLSQ